MRDVVWQFTSDQPDEEVRAFDLCTQVLIDTDLDAKAVRRLIMFLDGRFGGKDPA